MDTNELWKIQWIEILWASQLPLETEDDDVAEEEGMDIDEY